MRVPERSLLTKFRVCLIMIDRGSRNNDFVSFQVVEGQQIVRFFVTSDRGSIVFLD